MKAKKKERLGDLLMESFKELEAILNAGKRPIDVLTVRTIEIIDPSDFTGRKIKALRNSLRLSTAVFAGAMGVSVKLVEQWESGRRKPSAMACRLLDTLKSDPKAFLSRVVRRAA